MAYKTKINGQQIERNTTGSQTDLKEQIKNLLHEYKILNKPFEDCTPFENSIIRLVYPANTQREKLWMGEYDNE